jgi:hypothetical protein
MARERLHFSSLSTHRSLIALGDRLVGFGPKEMLEWGGGEFDPEAFDVDEVNRELQRLK